MNMKVKAFLVTALSCSLFLTACSADSGSVSSSGDPATSPADSSSITSTAPSSSPTSPTATPGAPTLVNGGTATYTVAQGEQTLSDSISYYYPELSGGSISESHLKKANEELRKAAEKLYNDHKDEKGLTLEVEYEVHFQNDSVISVSYKSDYNFDGAAQPGIDYATITWDLTKERVLTLEDLYTVDEAFLNDVFAANPTNKDNRSQVMVA